MANMMVLVTSSVALQWIRSLPVRFEFHFPYTHAYYKHSVLLELDRIRADTLHIIRCYCANYTYPTYDCLSNKRAHVNIALFGLAP